MAIRMQAVTVMLIAFSALFGIGADKDERQGRYWIFFSDKGSHPLHGQDAGQAGFRSGISQHALRLRRKVRPQHRLFDKTDLPLNSSYCAALENLKVSILTRSRWLNAVSARVPGSALDRLQSLPFVRHIQPVATLTSRPPDRVMPRAGRMGALDVHRFDYGESFLQNNQVRICDVHDLGLTGKGVRIGVLDAGFDYRDRPVFSHLIVAAERDFFDGNANTANETGDSERQDDHGTEVLSVLGGFSSGRLIGSAFGATFALGKTEWIPFERPIEEDKWVQGIEWLTDSVGVDIVSSSLGYDRFDGNEGYSKSDMNGRTCVTTVAAEIAAGRGVVVVNSAGNEGDDSWRIVSAPADGEHVIAAAAVTLEGTRADFSSVGPTADGRIKPDVAALGVGTFCVDPSRDGEETYLFASGTSLSCPIISGICALVLQAHPELNPEEVAEALRNTASQADRPDTLLGWGIADAYRSVFFHGMIVRNLSAIRFPLQDRDAVEFDLVDSEVLTPDSVSLSWYTGGSETIASTRAESLWAGHFRAFPPNGLNADTLRFSIIAKSVSGRIRTAPFRAPERLYLYSELNKSEPPYPVDEEEPFVLRSSFPNPFRAFTYLEIMVNEQGNFEVSIFDILGRQVRTFGTLRLEAGSARIEWDGTDGNGKQVPSGLYVCRVRSSDRLRSIKLIRISR